MEEIKSIAILEAQIDETKKYEFQGIVARKRYKKVYAEIRGQKQERIGRFD